MSAYTQSLPTTHLSPTDGLATPTGRSHPTTHRSPLGKSSIYAVEDEYATTAVPYHNPGTEMDWTFQPEPQQYNLTSQGHLTPQQLSPQSQGRGRSPAQANLSAELHNMHLSNVQSAHIPSSNASDVSNVSPPESAHAQFYYPPPAANHSRSSSRSSSQVNLAGPGRHSHYRSSSASSVLFLDYRGDTASMADFSQNVLTSYLGDNSASLMPRMKTIELYRKNAKKSNDPAVLFQYAQYILQTALMVDDKTVSSSNSQDSIGSERKHPPANSMNDLLHAVPKSASSASLPIPKASSDSRLKKELLKEAVHYLRRLSDRGYSEAQYLLGDAYSSGALGRVDNKEAFVLFQHAAKHGHAESAYRTSYCYEEGLGTGRDARKAVEFLKSAAARIHPAAMYKLGVYSFYSRMGLPNNVTTKKAGIQWLSRAVDRANELVAGAPYELAKIHFAGFEDIIIPDKHYALELYAQAAALGHVPSATLLGRFYEIGDVVPQDANLSIHYYTQAALGGDAEAMLAMCAWYLVGADPYLVVDEMEAFEWAKRAASCGLVKAQFALGHFYEKGIGCQANMVEAEKWYTNAATAGDAKAIARMQELRPGAKLPKTVTKKKSAGKLLQKAEAKSSKPPQSARQQSPAPKQQPIAQQPKAQQPRSQQPPAPKQPSKAQQPPQNPPQVKGIPSVDTAYKGAPVAKTAPGKVKEKPKNKDCVVM